MARQSIEHIAVIGAGTMGHGIAQSLAQVGYKVCLTDISNEALKHALTKVKANAKWSLKQNLITKHAFRELFSNLETQTERSKATRSAEFVIEAVFENPKLKKKIFAELDRTCNKETILASNTSSIDMDDIASETSRPENCVGMHWWNPPHLMPLVEVVRGKKTSARAIQLAKQVALRAGKTPVVCKNSPGLLGVRIQAALLLESLRVLEEGLASPEEIDTAVKLTLGLRLPTMGPLRIADLGGIDIFANAYEYLYHKLGRRFEPPRILRNMVARNMLGVKTRKGFYSYNQRQIAKIVNERDNWTAKQLRAMLPLNSHRED